MAMQAVSGLSGALPVVVEGEVWEEAAEEIDDLVIGDAEVWCAPVPVYHKLLKLLGNRGVYRF
jgi:hypothetical protein